MTASLDILYQDEHLIAVDKPVGLPIHKNQHMARDADYLTKRLGQQLDRSVYNVHRLDAKTSGVLLLALSSEAAAACTQLFEQRRIEKQYYLIVRENPGSGSFDTDIPVRKKSRKQANAVTHYRTLDTVQTDISYKEFENISLSLVEAEPETGRWHQLRQHFARQRYDIIGDGHHGDFALNRIIRDRHDVNRLLLHARQLRFGHPFTGQPLVLEAPVPDSFRQLLDAYKS